MGKFNPKKILSFLVIFLFASLFVLIIGRLTYIHLTGEVQSVDLISYAEKIRTEDEVLEAERGQILGRYGMVLAGNKPVYNMYAILSESYTGDSPVPLHVTDFQKTAEQVAPIVGAEPEQIENILEFGEEEGRFQIEFGQYSKLNQEQKEKIETLNLPGIYFDKQLERYYPNGEFASHVIGFTKKVTNDDTGLEETVGAYGVELSYEDELSGEDGYVRYQEDQFGYKLLNANEQVKPTQDGLDIYLTIDQKIQTFLEDAMTTVQEEYNPSKIIGVVMDPKTGAVLAMSNRPSFNPNSRKNIENWYNDVISYPFEPGSTMKIFTLASAIEEGVYTGNDKYMSGSYELFGETINDYNGEGWGVITYDEGLRHSSNVAFSKMVWEQLGTDTFLEYLKAFDFNQTTGIDLEGEIAGQILTGPFELVTTGFGQGSTFTPIQIMKAATAIANDGQMLKPYITQKVVNPNTGEIVYKNKPESVGQPISPETAKKVRDLLETTITYEDSTGNRFQLDDFTTFGKTGTAQIPDTENGGYLSGADNYTYSFIGMAPKEDPKLMMYIAVKQPEIDYSFNGSKTTSYIYKTVMENSLHYLDVNPNKDDSFQVKSRKLSDIVGQSTDEVVQSLRDNGYKVTVLGSGDRIVDSIPKEGEVVLENQHIMIKTNGKVRMPNITDWSLREVLSLVELMDVKLDFLGSGFVTKQNLKPGTPLTEESVLVVELKTRNELQKEKENQQTEGTQDSPEQNKEQPINE